MLSLRIINLAWSRVAGSFKTDKMACPVHTANPGLIIGIGNDPDNGQSLTFAILFRDGDKSHLTVVVDLGQAYLFAFSYDPHLCSGCRAPLCLGQCASNAFSISPAFSAGSSGPCGKLCE